MSSTRLLAKIETRQALLNFQGILSEADGIIISRGALCLVKHCIYIYIEHARRPPPPRILSDFI
jgi:hypothetical protein